MHQDVGIYDQDLGRRCRLGASRLELGQGGFQLAHLVLEYAQSTMARNGLTLTTDITLSHTSSKRLP